MGIGKVEVSTWRWIVKCSSCFALSCTVDASVYSLLPSALEPDIVVKKLILKKSKLVLCCSSCCYYQAGKCAEYMPITSPIVILHHFIFVFVLWHVGTVRLDSLTREYYAIRTGERCVLYMLRSIAMLHTHSPALFPVGMALAAGSFLNCHF